MFTFSSLSILSFFLSLFFPSFCLSLLSFFLLFSLFYFFLSLFSSFAIFFIYLSSFFFFLSVYFDVGVDVGIDSAVVQYFVVVVSVDAFFRSLARSFAAKRIVANQRWRWFGINWSNPNEASSRRRRQRRRSSFREWRNFNSSLHKIVFLFLLGSRLKQKRLLEKARLNVRFARYSFAE